jgi:hypothetical protein
MACSALRRVVREKAVAVAIAVTARSSSSRPRTHNAVCWLLILLLTIYKQQQ